MKYSTTSYEYMQVNTRDIFTDPLYQRGVDAKRVGNIVKEFDPNLVNPPKLSYRDGKYYVFDGQHTISVLKARNKGRDVKVECKVYYGLTRLDEMNLFIKQNGRSKAVLTRDKFRALYKNGDPEITEMVRACESVGFAVTFEDWKDQGNTIIALKTLYNSYMELGSEDFTEVLRLLKDAWNGMPDSLSREFIAGMTLFYKTYKNKYKRPMLVNKLKKLDPAILLREAKSITRKTPVGCARMFVRAYNRNLTEKSRLEEKL